MDIVASAGTVGGPITCSVDSVVPNPVCQGNYIYIYWHLSDTLCDGSYTIQLSNSSGTFPGTNAWVFNVYYPQTSGVISIQLPNSVAAGNCYKIRINRTSPFPTITGVASACFSIIVCSNNIATLQPIVTTDTNSVCIGSAIDVPFWSTGAYSSNTYIAQLSDSNGVFPVMPTVINSMLNSNTYSSSLPPFQPGSVSGIMPNVTPGCNYFIRVVSTNPVAIGTPWGPFCIGQCDIETNNNTDIDFCVTDCFVNPLGQNTTISVGINTFDSTGTGAVYNSGNIFKTQLLSSLNFAQIGSNGILGEVAATHDTIMSIHVPCADSLSYYGISSGEYYMRTIATNTTQPDNALGGLIRVTIGATHAVGPTITCYDYSTFIPADTACMGVSIFPMFSPYNYSNNSTYLWSISGFNGGLPFQSPMGGNSDNCGYAFNFIPGSYTFSVQETNNGCVGPWSPLTTVIVLAPPAVPIAGPSTICAGDTAHYYIPAQTGLTSGVWSSNNGNGILLNSTYTDIDVIGQTTGNFLLTIQATNFCGLSSNSRNLLVKPYPLLGTNGDTSICANQSLTLSTPLGTGYIYNWMDGTNTLSTYDSVTVNPTNTTSYFLSVTGPGQCISRDTVLVTVNLVDTSVVQNGLLLTANASNAFYQWLYCNTGNSPISGAISQNYSATSDGTYSVIVTQNGCMDTSSCYSVTTVGLTENTLDNSITISPNPFTSQTIISFHGEQRNTTIKITDVLGKEIKTLTFSGKQCTLEKGEMKAGIYFVNITDEKKNVVNRKIIIQ